MWRKDFDFSNRYGAITLVCKPQSDRKLFYKRDELIVFLKEHGIRLDDLKHPLEITGPHDHVSFGPDTYNVIQWTLVGWLKDDYR